MHLFSNRPELQELKDLLVVELRCVGEKIHDSCRGVTLLDVLVYHIKS